MPIRYTIHPQLDILLYIFEGYVTVDDYFNTYEKAYQDSRRHHGMKVLCDLLYCEPEIDVSLFKKGISIMRENRDSGYAPDHLAILTTASSFDYLANVIKILADDIPVYLQVFYNFSDAVHWLGLENHEKELKEFWKAFEKE
jgi:hypothetical protein